MLGAMDADEPASGVVPPPRDPAQPYRICMVCLGNICRSPMAERLLAAALRQRLGDRAAEFVHVESAGTGGWHVGEPMNPPAAGELRRRGASPEGFRARRLLGAHLDAADLILTATAEQLQYVAGLRPDAAARSFVLGELGRLLSRVDPADLPDASLPGADLRRADGPATVYARGVALVAAVDAARDGADPQPGDDLDDPWGRAAAVFTRTADEIDATVAPLVELLLPKRP